MSERDRLRCCNLGASVLHACWVFGLIIYGSVQNSSTTGWGQTLPVYCSRNVWCGRWDRLPACNSTNALCGSCGSSSVELCAGTNHLIPEFCEMGRGVELIPELYKCGSLNTMALLVSFFFLSSVFHAYNVWSLGFENGFYLRELRGGLSFSRYLEYSISASVMILLIVYSLGINTLNALVSFFALIFGVQWMGHAAEYAHRDGEGENSKYFFHFAGWLLMCVVIVLTVVQWNETMRDADSAPPWLWSLLVGDFVLFSSFAVVQLWQFAAPSLRLCGSTDPHIQGEFMFIVLSFVCKSFLGVLSCAFLVSRDFFESVTGSS